MRIYVASSWRNARQAEVVAALREAGHEVYDFKHPGPGNEGFRWSDIDPDWQNWALDKYLWGLTHSLALEGFAHDANALEHSDACVLVLPCGRSAHLEAGFAVGRGKPLFILHDVTQPLEPELMYRWATWQGSELDGAHGLIFAVECEQDVQRGMTEASQCEEE